MEKAIGIKRKDPVPYYYLGKIELETGSGAEIDQAISHFGEAIKANAKFAPAYRELGNAYYRKRDRASAIQAYERYLELEPKAKDAARIRVSIDELASY